MVHRAGRPGPALADPARPAAGLRRHARRAAPRLLRRAGRGRPPASWCPATTRPACWARSPTGSRRRPHAGPGRPARRPSRPRRRTVGPRRRRRPAGGPAQRRRGRGAARQVAVLGWVYPGKGHAEVLAALDGLPGDVGLRVLGGASPGHADLLDGLAALARDGGRDLHVDGWVDDDDLPDLLRAVDVPGVRPPARLRLGLADRVAGRGPTTGRGAQRVHRGGRPPRPRHAAAGRRRAGRARRRDPRRPRRPGDHVARRRRRPRPRPAGGGAPDLRRLGAPRGRHR